MNNLSKYGLTTLALAALALPVIASDVTIPNEFTAGTPARAGEVNANFSALAQAVNDNDTRISDNASAVDELSMENAIAYASGENSTAAPQGTADVVVQSLTVFAPVDGHVNVVFTTWFICTSSASCVPRCSVAEDVTIINTTNFTLESTPSRGYSSLAITYGQPVSAGDTTLNAVCDVFEGSGTFGDFALTATFAAKDHTVP